MKTATATSVKNQFGQFLETALTQPVAISKTGRRVAVLLAWREYERLAALEDLWWAKSATMAEAQGYLGPRATRRLLRNKLNAEA